MTIAKRAKAPWHTGLLEGAVWGGVVEGAAGLAAFAVEGTAATASAPALVTAAIIGIVGSVAGFAVSVNKVIEKREEYEASPVINAATAQRAGTVQQGVTQQAMR